MFQVDAFSETVFGGNPAAVLLLEDWLPDELMQSIANENNLAETAFVKPSGDHWALRWFTPTVEVNFCGHATLATAHILITEFGVPGTLRFSTRVGDLNVQALGNEYLLDLPCIEPEHSTELPPCIVPLFLDNAVNHFKNFENVFIQLASEQEVRTYQPDLNTLAQLGPVGVVITATGETYDFISRYFAPGAGIPEDPVTGSIHATLVPYWAEKLGKRCLSAFQASSRGGILQCELQEDRVLIKGKAATFMKAEIYLPD
ncbi:PhzF family phenazine biosynthesis protein [Pseudomonas synxantha]|uniref:PhzF family phenazine biosynthesis protein n=1 Tax=Pseudomonas synxantha TaxID=47883 RepID=UPI001F36BF51|nr:PhzF family phenazine biosynthesis protein [Pseudomonas synxantha]